MGKKKEEIKNEEEKKECKLTLGAGVMRINIIDDGISILYNNILRIFYCERLII